MICAAHIPGVSTLVATLHCLRCGLPALLVAAFATCMLWALDPSRPVDQFSRKVWRVEEGLPENFVRAMVQTHDGYLWLGTQEGLVRFDGLQLRIFDTRNTPELASNSITALCEDRDGILWIGTDGGGITRHRDGKFVDRLSTLNGLENDYIRNLHASPDGNVWITAHSGGLIRMRGKERERWTTADGLPSDSLRTVLLDRTGRLWIATDEDGLTMLHQGVLRHFGHADGLANDQIRVLYEDSQGQIWVGTRGAGLYRWDGNSFLGYTIRDGLPANFIRAITEDRDGALWVGLESGGLTRFHRGKFEVLDTSRGLPHNFVRTLLEDAEGNLWAGTRGGLLRLRDRTVETWTTTEGLINDNVKTVLADDAGAVWIGTATGANVIRGGRMETVTLSGEFAKDFVRAIAQGRQGTMWFGTDIGLFRRNHGGVHLYRQTEGLPDDRVRSILDDSFGRVWVGTARGLAILPSLGLRSADKRKQVAIDAALETAYIHALAQDRSGIVWVGTNEGLFRFNGKGWTRFTTLDGLSHNTVTTLHVDERGGLWAGTRGGLSHLLGNRFAAVTRRDGLYSDNVQQVLSDGRGNIWLTSPRGVSRLDIRQLESFFLGEVPAVQPIFYDTADGMRSSEFGGDGHPSGSRAPDGRLWFPTVHGLVVFDPAQLGEGGKPPHLRLEEVRAGQRTFPGRPSTIEIPAGTGDLELQFTAISFAAPERIRFRYRLEGFDPDWIDAGRRRVAYYTNLPPGEYRFRVEANPFNGSWPVEEVSQALILRPHFYQQSWFFALCLAAGVALVFLAYQIRINGIQRRFDAVLAERTRIAREIHDTLMQGVTGISLQLEASAQNLLDSPADAKRRIDLALEKLDATLAEARECVLALRTPQAPSGDMVTALREMAEQITAGLPLSLQFEVKGTERTLPPDQQAQVLRIAREAVTNTAAHACAQKLKVSLAFEPDCVRLAAWDDGRGFEPARVNGGHFGIVGMQERARAIGASLELRSSPGAGTEVVVSLPTHAHS